MSWSSVFERCWISSAFEHTLGSRRNTATGISAKIARIHDYVNVFMSTNFSKEKHIWYGFTFFVEKWVHRSFLNPNVTSLNLTRKRNAWRTTICTELLYADAWRSTFFVVLKSLLYYVTRLQGRLEHIWGFLMMESKYFWSNLKFLII